MTPINGAGAVGAVELRGPERVGGAPKPEGADFASVLSDAVGEARTDERAAMQASAGFAAGDPSVGIHEVMIAAEKANVSLRYATTLKNKLLEAYRELMNTQV